MHLIEPNKGFEWKTEGECWVPATVDTQCPYCNLFCSLVISGYLHQPQTNTVGMIGKCARCGKTSKLWAVNVKTKGGQGGHKCEEIWMLPKPKVKNIEFDKTLVPEEIFDAYEEAVNCFNGGHWRATVTECGRALEGVTQDKFKTKEERKILKDITANKYPEKAGIESVKSVLFEPIIKLSSSIRLGRLTGAHFNIKGKANEEVAEQVLSLTEYLIKYFYILPGNALKLEEKINALGDTGLTEDED